MVNNGYAVGMAVEVYPPIEVGYDSATLVGNLTSLGGHPNATVFFTYTKTGEDDWYNTTKTKVVNSIGSFNLTISNFNEYTNYTYKSIVSYGSEVVTSIGNETFLTSDAPNGSYSATADEDNNAITFNVTITDMGNATNISLYTNCSYNDGANYTISTTVGPFTEIGSYSTSINLEEDITYSCYPTIAWTYDGDDFLKQLTSFESHFESTSDVEEGINTAKTMIFVAFTLIGLIILVTIVMFVITILNNGAMSDGLINVAIWTIGASVVVMIGYVIISAVAQALL